ncbi:MAG: FecR domain-containing protein, partial [Pseudohongiellaceae bacterium]
SYTSNARIVQLLAGEAFFDVAHDPELPFLVYVGKYAVRAVGTAFSVQAGQNSVDVIVTDGRIEVSSFENPPSDTQVLDLDLLRSAGALVPLDKGQMGVFNEQIGKLELVQE